MPDRDETIVPTNVLDVYADGSKLDNAIGIGVHSRKLDLKLSLRLPHYCNVLQAGVMAIYRAAQWILANSVSLDKDL